MASTQTFVNNFTTWAMTQDNILGVVLVGSHAKGTAKPTSDIDLIIITKNPDVYLSDNEWIDQFGQIKEVFLEDWGILKSKRVTFEDDLEVEFGITPEEWAKINPVDKGTKKVMTDGHKILLDKHSLLRHLVNSL